MYAYYIIQFLPVSGKEFSWNHNYPPKCHHMNSVLSWLYWLDKNIDYVAHFGFYTSIFCVVVNLPAGFNILSNVTFLFVFFFLSQTLEIHWTRTQCKTKLRQSDVCSLLTRHYTVVVAPSTAFTAFTENISSYLSSEDGPLCLLFIYAHRSCAYFAMITCTDELASIDYNLANFSRWRTTLVSRRKHVQCISRVSVGTP